jgi:hypothetical protein
MAEGWGPTAGNASITSATSTYPWYQLHVGAPGAAGTANIAVETTRKQVTSWATASGGSQASSSALSWTNVAGSEDFTKVSTWTASSAGTFGFSGVVTANPVVAGDTFSVASADVVVSVQLAS